MDEEQKKSPSSSGASAFGTLVMIALGGWYFYGGGVEKHAAAEMGRIEQTVAADAVQQYEIAKRNGTPMDACSAAGMMAAAYLQANDEPNYARAKQVERDDCAKAGMPE